MFFFILQMTISNIYLFQLFKFHKSVEFFPPNVHPCQASRLIHYLFKQHKTKILSRYQSSERVEKKTFSSFTCILQPIYSMWHKKNSNSSFNHSYFLFSYSIQFFFHVSFISLYCISRCFFALRYYLLSWTDDDDDTCDELTVMGRYMKV